MKSKTVKDIIAIICGIVAGVSIAANVDILFSYLTHLDKSYALHIPILKSLWLWPNIFLTLVLLICVKVVMSYCIGIQIRRPLPWYDIVIPTFLLSTLILFCLAIAEDYYLNELHRHEPVLFSKTVLYWLLHLGAVCFLPVFMMFIAYILRRRIIISKPGSNN